MSFDHLNYDYLYKEICENGKSIGSLAKENNCSYDVIRYRVEKYKITRPIKISLFRTLEGKKFGKLLVGKIVEIRKKKSNGHYLIFYECFCDCGNYIKRINCSRLLTNKTNFCKKCNPNCCKNAEKSPNWTGYKLISGKYWSNLTNNAKKRNINFDLNIEQVYFLLEKQNKKCNLSGMELTSDNFSLDRMNSSEGYVLNNIQWVHKDINISKWDIEQNVFIDFCKQIYNYKKLCIIPKIENKNDTLKFPEFDLDHYKHLNILTGQTIGFWKIGDIVDVKFANSHQKKYICTCKCGHISYISKSHLLSTKINKLCSKCSGEISRNNKSAHWCGYEGISKTSFKTWKYNADVRNIEFKVSMKDIWEQYEFQERRCVYTGNYLNFKHNHKDKLWTASLDRKDSSKHYTIDNIQLIHKTINKIKYCYSEEYFLNLCFLVAENKK